MFSFSLLKDPCYPLEGVWVVFREGLVMMAITTMGNQQ